VATFDQRATLDDPHTVRLADGSTHTAKHILIATGGRPERPGMPIHLGIVSDDIFNLENCPSAADRRRRLHRLRVRLHHERPRRGGDAVLPRRADPARLRRGGAGLISEMMEEKGVAACRHQYRRHGARLADHDLPDRDGDRRGHGRAAGVKRGRTDDAGGPVWVKASNGTEGVFDKVLFATGRRPNTDGMGLERGGRRRSAAGAGRRRRILADRRAFDLRHRRRDQPREPDPGRDPRGHGLRRDGVQRQSRPPSITT
jgi:glutathione reductase (NADPH)